MSTSPRISARNTSANSFELAGKRVFVAGHTGMAGSAIVRRLRQEACDVLVIEHRALDLTRQAQSEDYLFATRPDVVIMAAGRVGGILANDMYLVDFLADNLAMALNCIRVSHLVGVKKLLFLGSSCIYPKLAKQPMSEDLLLTGELERSSRRMNGMRSQKSQASSCAKPTIANTAAISYRSCPPTCMDPAITIIRNTAMLLLR